MYTTFYAQKDLQGLQQLVSVVTLWIFWPSLAIALALIVWAQPVLGVFGSEFVVGDWQLKILVLGQLVNALCGSVSLLMVMTGHQNKCVVVFGCGALMNLVLNPIAIPMFGAVGAAIATTCTIVMWNIWLSILVVRNVGVHPSIFSTLLFRLKNEQQPEGVTDGCVAKTEDDPVDNLGGTPKT